MATTAKPARLCKATTLRGEPCQTSAGAGSDYCFHHDPAKAAARAAARSKGGKARHGRAITYIPSEQGDISIKTAGDVMRVIEQAINDALHMERSLNRSRTLGSLAAIALRAVEVTELAERVTALEKLIHEGKAGKVS